MGVFPAVYDVFTLGEYDDKYVAEIVGSVANPVVNEGPAILLLMLL
jgi:hypothetical protein